DGLLRRMLRETPGVQARVLLLRPDCEAMISYFRQREYVDPENEALMRAEIVKRALEQLKQRYNLEYAYYDDQPSWKIIRTDGTAFVAAYDRSKRGAKLPIGEFPNFGRPYYVAYSHYFEEMWTRNS